MELNLTAQNKQEELVLKYLQNNASETLADKINNGTPFEKDGKPLLNKKTLAGFMKYACDEARKLAEKGANSACIDDATVYGWAIHYFEEESIEGTLYTIDGAEYKPTVKRRPKKIEEVITVADDGKTLAPVEEKAESPPIEEKQITLEDLAEETQETAEENTSPPKPIKTVKTTKKQVFDKFYADSLNLPKTARKRFIIEGMRSFFKSAEATETYVTLNMERKYKNLVARRVRLVRKVNLQTFNYFVTLTYNDAIHTEATFKKKLRTTLGHFSNRKGWKYVGVWERSPKKQRLHFHGIFYIPDDAALGKMTDVESYSFSERKRQITKQSEYFNLHFGRNDFRPIEDKTNIGEAVAYIIKYIEKSGEKLVYSRGLPQFFISDIMDDDIAAPIGLEDKKLLLFDDFICWDEGCYMGEVSKEVISQMRKSN